MSTLEVSQAIDVLLLSDDPESSKTIREVLRESGPNAPAFVVSDATTEEAVERIQAGRPDVVLVTLTDDRDEILAMIRRIRQGWDIPIITIGGSGMEQLALAAIRLGAQDSILKDSIDGTRLVPMIQYAIERRKISSSLINLHKNQISATIEAVSDGILIASSDQKVLFANRAAERLLDKSAVELVGEKVPLPMSPGKRIPFTIETNYGSVTHVEITTTVVPWGDGESGFCLTIHDVSEYRKIEEELKRASYLKDEFIAHISHELRTPMNGIIGMTSLLEDQSLPDDIRSYVDTIRSSGHTMLDIINDLLDMSKIEAGKLELEIGEFDIRALVEETMDLFAEAARNRRLTLSAIVAPDVPRTFKADSSRIRQVLANLVSNAIKFTDRGSIVIMVDKVLDSEDRLAITVRDTGIGIRREDLNQLFQPFTQLSTDPKRKVGGTGLGLVISKKLVSLWDGEIVCQSHYGKGSAFSFTVNGEAGQKPTDLAAAESALKGRTIGLLSSDRHCVAVLHKILKGQGAKVVRLRTSRMDLGFDAVIYDNPDLLDLEALQTEIEGIRRWCPKPVLIVGCKSTRRIDPWQGRVVSIPRYPLRQSELLSRISALLSPGRLDAAERTERRERVRSVFEVPRFGKRMRVLVAEDNIINQKVATSLLEQIGIEADAVGNGKEAVEAASRFDYDAILMDCRMPVMDGYEAARMIRKTLPGYKTKPIIAVTASAMNDEVEKCKASGMDSVLAKPITVETLRQTLYRALNPKDGEERRVVSIASVARTAIPVRTSVLDSLEKVSEKVGNTLVEEVITLFVRQTPHLIDRLEEAVKTRNRRSVEYLSHKIKGSARNVGADGLAEKCARLESLGDQVSWDACREVVEVIRQYFAEACDYLRSRYRFLRTSEERSSPRQEVVRSSS